MKNIFIIVAIALSLVGIGSLAYIFTRDTKMVPPTYIHPSLTPVAIVSSPSASAMVAASPSASTKKLYVSKHLKIKFDYPDRYVVDASKESSDSAVRSVSLFLKEDYDALINVSPRPGRGGPTQYIHIGGFLNTKKLTALQWAKTNINYSNYPGSHTVEKIAGEDALSYTFEGMGLGTVRVFSHGDFIYALTGSANDDQTKEDFKALLKSISFVE